MFKICVDTGGTFTEAVVLDDKGHFAEFKTPTTPTDFSEGVLNAITEAAPAYGRPLSQFMAEIEWIVLGTTVALNALVTRRLAKTALITTRGFRDIVEMRRALKIETHSMYEAAIPPYEPIVPRYLRFVVEEATRYTGEITTPVNEADLTEVIRKIKKEGVEAVAVCFINSYANPENERKAAEICRRDLKDVFVTYSSDIIPTMGEYSRESTCILSASVGPVVSRYMTSLENRLKGAGFKGQLLIIQANQFVQSVSAILRKPVYLIGSGPSAASAGAALLGKAMKKPNFITADMGGTTLDASVIQNGKVPLAVGKWIGDERMGIMIPDISSIGAGGGSIGWVDSLGLIRSGPQSAGAEPGPACYNKGGKEPTVTDAALILGYIPADYFCGGKIKLNIDLARAAVKKIADRMNMTIEQAAEAMFATVNSNMADEITEISTRMGYDVRDFALLAIGGGGPLCGAFMADVLGMKEVVVPRFAASFCAWSMFALDIGRDYVRSFISVHDKASPDAMNGLYQDMVEEALADFKTLNISKKDVVFSTSADLRYHGQYHEIQMDLPAGELTLKSIEQAVRDFHKKHEELYTFALPWVPVEFRNLRLIAKVNVKKNKLKKRARGGKDPSRALKRKRPCFSNGKFVNTPVYDSSRLKPGNVISGPAIVEEPTTTVVVPKEFDCILDEYENYVIRRV
ncbi:MAG: hydantoinase/oxoprolinase family protein [Pseudomonadota bacterium]